MAEIIRMPKMSDTMEEGVIATWLKKQGDLVKSGDILAEIETDKATMELEAYENGTLLHIGVKEKDTVPVNAVIAIIGEKKENISALLQKIKQGNTTQKDNANKAKVTIPQAQQQENNQKAMPTSQPSTTIATTKTNETTKGRIKASPLAKKIAQKQGYNLASIKGTGEEGRIVKHDVETFTPRTQLSAPIATTLSAFSPVLGEEAYDDLPISQMRKTIAKRLAESKFNAPHFYLTITINMEKAVEARKSSNAYAAVKISFNDMIVKATAMAIRQHPNVNVAWLGNTIRYNKHIHMGVAIAVEEGLLVPVIRFTDHKSLTHIAVEIKMLSTKAHNKQLQPQDWEGSTFAISNLGMFDIEAFTAIINPPAACILAIGKIQQAPIVQDGKIVPAHMMKATLSCDHRVVDGATGAAFLKTLKALLEDPVRMLV